MKHEAEIYLNGVEIEEEKSYPLNEYFTLSYKGEKTVISAKILETPPFEACPSMLIEALNATFPKSLISTFCFKSTADYYKKLWKSNVLFSYYGNSNYDNTTNSSLNDETIEYLKEWCSIIISNNSSTTEENRWNPWNVAWNEYLDACSCGIVEKAFAHLITSLEALIIKGNNELSYRVSLYASILLGDNNESRIEIFECVKKSYNYRSKSVHGDVKDLKKDFKKETIYEMFFQLKQIVSSILFKTFGKEKTDIINSIEESIYNCPIVHLE